MTTVISNTFNLTVSQKKWNPGQYVAIASLHDYYLQSTPWTGYLLTRTTELANEPKIAGLHVWLFWKDMEPVSQGTYDWSKPQWILDHCQSNGLMCRFSFSPQSYTNRDEQGYFPQWAIDAGHLASTPGNPHPYAVLKWWDSDAVDAWNAFLGAFATQFDDHPALEMVEPLRERAVGPMQNTYPEYTDTGRDAGMISCATYCNNVFVKTNLVMAFNAFLGSNQSLANQTVNAYRQLNPPVGLSWPDTAPSYNDWPSGLMHINNGLTSPQRLYQKSIVIGETGIGSSAAAGQIVAPRVETSELGIGSVLGTDGLVCGLNVSGNSCGYLPQTIYDYAKDNLQCSHFAWPYNENLNSNELQKWPEIKRVIQDSAPFTNTGYPY